MKKRESICKKIVRKKKELAFLVSTALLFSLLTVGNAGAATNTSLQQKEQIAEEKTDSGVATVTGAAITMEPAETASGGAIETEAPVPTESPVPTVNPIPTGTPVTGGAVTVKAVTKNQTDTIFVAEGKKVSTVLFAEVEQEEGKEVDIEGYEFQWYQKSGKVWKAIESGTAFEYQASVKKAGTFEYYCIVHDVSTQQKWKSNIVTVIGYSKQLNITLRKKVTVGDIFGAGFDVSKVKKLTVVNGYNNATVKKTTPKAYKKYRKLNYKKYISVSKKYTITAKKYCQKGQLRIKGTNGQSFTISITVKFPKPKMVLKLSKNKKILTGNYKQSTVKGAAYMNMQFMSAKQKKYISWSPFSNKFKNPGKKGKYVNATKLKIKKYRVCAVYKTDFGIKKSAWTMIHLK